MFVLGISFKRTPAPGPRPSLLQHWLFHDHFHQVQMNSCTRMLLVLQTQPQFMVVDAILRLLVVFQAMFSPRHQAGQAQLNRSAHELYPCNWCRHCSAGHWPDVSNCHGGIMLSCFRHFFTAGRGRAGTAHSNITDPKLPNVWNQTRCFRLPRVLG